MERLFILILLITSCSISQQQQNSEHSQNRPEADHSQNKTDNANPPNSSEDWAVVSNTEYGRNARITAIDKTPDGEAYTFLKLLCPTKKDKEFVASFEYSVSNPDKIPSFNFEYFEGPNAPALKEKLVEIQASSPKGNLNWHFVATGNYGGFAEVIHFDFSPSSNNKPDKTAEFARMIAEGSTAVTITVHDGKDNQKVIKTTFPAINPSSDTAKILNGCRK